MAKTGSTTNYAYGPDGSRIRTTATVGTNPAETSYLICSSELDPAGVLYPRSRIPMCGCWFDRVLAYHRNHLASVTLETGASASIVQRQRYTAFGDKKPVTTGTACGADKCGVRPPAPLLVATFEQRKDGTTGLDHILDRHGDPYAQEIDPRAGQFTAEYSKPDALDALNDLADRVIGATDEGVLQANGNTIYFGTEWLRDNNSGESTPYMIGATGIYKGAPSMPTNIVAVVNNPRGEVVTMFPTRSAYSISKDVVISLNYSGVGCAY